MAMTPAPLADQQRCQLSEKRSAHLKPMKQDNFTYLPNQPIWFTDDDSDEWKPGYIESKDTAPDSYWIINDKTNRRIRRNKCDIKPRYATVAQQRPQPQVPVRCPVNLSDENLTPLVPLTPSEKPPADTPCTVGKSPPLSGSEKETPKKAKEETTGGKPAVSTPPLTRTHSGRVIKPPRNPDFV